MSLQLNRTTFGDPANKGNVLTKDEAETLLNAWVLNERLKLHMKQVAHLMLCWAKEMEHLNGDEQWQWQMAGLLHDADWDQWPDQHCKKIIEELEQRQVDPVIIHAIASHGPAHFGVEPVTKMDKMLFAFDELSGLCTCLCPYASKRVRRNGCKGCEKAVERKKLCS